MRHTLLFFILASGLLVERPCDAQKYIGVVVGANFANESFNPPLGGVSTSNRSGILAGIQLERWFNSQWGFSSQFLYLQGGSNDNLNGMGTGFFYGITTVGSETIATKNIDLDLLLKKTIWGNNTIRTYAFAGPGMGSFLSGSDNRNVTLSQNGNAFGRVDTTFIMQFSNTCEFSIVFGLGISIMLDSGLKFFCDAGYWYGLTNIFEFYGSSTDTRDIRVTAGMLFPIYFHSLF